MAEKLNFDLLKFAPIKCEANFRKTWCKCDVKAVKATFVDVCTTVESRNLEQSRGTKTS